jgi:hypothetical protein
MNQQDFPSYRILYPTKISDRLVFDRAELDKVLANGDHKMGRGRLRRR